MKACEKDKSFLETENTFYDTHTFLSILPPPNTAANNTNKNVGKKWAKNGRTI